MAEIKLLISGTDGPIDIGTAEGLRRDIDREVGPADFAASAKSTESGAKSPFDLAQAGTLIVQLLGTQAIIQLVAVLKSYVDRDRITEIEVTGPHGSAKLKLPAGSRASAEDITRAISGIVDADEAS